MVDSITSSSVSANSFAQAASGGQALDRDAFLKLFVAQLKNQDPLQPQENHEFVAQLAQFSSLEQTVGINDRLDQLTLQNRGLQNSEAIALVGKQVEVRGNLVTMAEGQLAVPLSFHLEGEATSAVVAVVDASGRELRTLEVGRPVTGLNTINWDGMTSAGVRAPPGAYAIAVHAVDESGARVPASQNSSGTVEGLSFDQGFPVLHLDSGLAVPIADLVRVSPAPTPAAEQE